MYKRQEYSYDGPTFQKKDTVYIHPETRIFLQAKDVESGLQSITYQINNEGEEHIFDEPIVLPKAGQYRIDFAGYDHVNNRNSTKFYCVVDNEAPTVEIAFGVEPQLGEDGVPFIPAYAGLYLSATDRHTGIKEMFYSLNNQPEKAYSGEISGFKANTSYKIAIRAVDKLGNSNVYERVFETR